jgi:hypothetical protein
VYKRQVYEYEQDGIKLKLTFLSPLFAEQINMVSRPVSYINWEIASNDQKEHDVSIYFSASAYTVVDQKNQNVVWSRKNVDSLTYLTFQSEEQNILGKSGDDVRIDWGYFHLIYKTEHADESYIGPLDYSLPVFTDGESLPAKDSDVMPTRNNRVDPVTSIVMNMQVTANETRKRHLMLAYDDIYSVELFGEHLLPYWRNEFEDFESMITAADNEFEQILDKAIKYDTELESSIISSLGFNYAQICNMAYRQSIAAHKVVLGPNGDPLCFSKENASNGSMGTVDVFYPASPIFLLFNTELIKTQVAPIFDYAAMDRWPWPYAPHDIGKYPKANGQTYGGGEISEDRQMPVEESGNMIILSAAISEIDGNTDFADKYWPLLTKWANYLEEKGYDPENQLCTDDFAGHLAHNTNLSIKAIVALACYGKMCRMKGDNDLAEKYSSLASEMAEKWVDEAFDHDNYRLAFDRPDTWSMKYNLIWDQILNLDLFPNEVIEKEIAFYKKNQNVYGLPLDNRKSYAKLDWVIWTAALADDLEDFKTLSDPVYRFLMQSPDRVPMSDWYWTKTGAVAGFKARSVVGGVFIKLLKNKLLGIK